MYMLARLSADKQKVLATFLVFSLSAGVLGGILFYMDSIRPDVLQEMTNDVSVDMQVALSQQFYEQNSTTMEEIENTIQEQQDVQASDILSMVRSYDWNAATYELHEHIYLGLSQNTFSLFPQAFDLLASTATLNDSSCYVEAATLEHYGLGLGDNFTAVARIHEEGTETIIEKEFIIVGSFQTGLYVQRWYSHEQDISMLRMVTTKSGLENAFPQLDPRGYVSRKNVIWVDLDQSSILSYGDAPPSDRAENIGKQIEQDTLPYAYILEYALENTFRSYTGWAQTVTYISLAFSIPSLVMGIMLVYYNSELLANQRRKNVGTLKTRGASGWQAFRWVLVQAVIVAFIGSLGAILVGLLSSYLSGSVRTFLEFSLERLASFTLLLEPDAIMWVFIFSFGVGLVVSIPTAVQALLMSPEEAHASLEREVLQEESNLGNPFIDLGAVGISTFFLFSMFSMFSYVASGYGPGGVYFSSVVVIFMGVFVVGLSRLLSRGGPNVKAKIVSRLKTKKYEPGSRLLSRTVMMFKKSESLAVIFVGLVFTAGLFCSISAQTGFNHTRSLSMFEAGGDIVVKVRPEVQNITLDMLDEITSIDGVKNASGVLETEGYVEYWQAYRNGEYSYIERSISVFGVEAKAWAETAFFLDYFANDQTPKQSLHDMSLSNQSVITSFKPIDGYSGSYGGTQSPIYSEELAVRLEEPGWINESECQIIDTLATLGQYGSSNQYFPGRPELSSFVIMNLDYVHACKNTSRVSSFYVKLNKGANYTRIMGEIADLSQSSFQSIESGLLNLDQSLDSRAAQTIYGVYTLNVVFSLIYLTAGIAIVTFVRIQNLRRPLSVLRALGTERKSIMIPMLIDSLATTAAAAGVGALIALALTGFAIQVPLNYIGTSLSLTWLRLRVVISVPFLIVALILCVTVAAVLLTTYFITRATLEKNIAEEIQYVS
ncbi:MAG: ABC transporter permease [Candidatus Thorarchaeota archaeon]